jgi:molybdenum cofactor cytidylyltransferase
MKIAGILLAAGAGTRFGGNKLEAGFRGEMLGMHAARALAGVTEMRIAVCSPGSQRLRAGLAALRYRIIDNPDPGAGMARSLALGLASLENVDGALVALADMPCIDANHLTRLIAAFDGVSAVASEAGSLRSPPAVVPRTAWLGLIAQTGDRGARDLLSGAQVVDTDTAMLADVDTAADLTRLL